MLGRRSFLIISGWSVALPALARARHFLARDTRSRILPLVDPLPQQVLAVDTDPKVAVLRIAGWESSFGSEQSPNTDVWLSINQSWRVAWR
jgi:hypothetical protein